MLTVQTRSSTSSGEGGLSAVSNVRRNPAPATHAATSKPVASSAPTIATPRSDAAARRRRAAMMRERGGRSGLRLSLPRSPLLSPSPPVSAPESAARVLRKPGLAAQLRRDGEVAKQRTVPVRRRGVPPPDCCERREERTLRICAILSAGRCVRVIKIVVYVCHLFEFVRRPCLPQEVRAGAPLNIHRSGTRCRVPIDSTSGRRRLECRPARSLPAGRQHSPPGSPRTAVGAARAGG